VENKSSKGEKFTSKSFLDEIYQSVFHHSFDAIFVLDAASRKILEMNECVSRTLGYSPAELLGQDFSILFPDDFELSLENILKRIHAFDSVLSGEKFLCKNGTTLAMDVTGYAEEVAGQACIIIILRPAKERNSIEQKLFYNNELYHSLMESLPDYVYIKNRFDDIVSVNKALTSFIDTITEKKPAQFLPKFFTDIIAKEDEEILLTGKIVLNRIDTLNGLKNGKDVWLLTTKVPVYSSAGKIDGILNISRDITETKNEMEELELGEKLYTLLFNISPVGIVIEDEHGVILQANKAYCASTGYSEAELVGQSIAMLATTTPMLAIKKNIEKILKGDVLEHEVENIGKKGIKRIFELHETKITLSGGKPGILVIANDISERKNSEKKLQQEGDLLRNLMNNIPDTIYFKDKESRFIRINAAQKQTLGVKKEEEAIGKTDFDFFTKSHASSALIDEQNIIRTGKPLIGKLEHIRTADGSYRWVSSTKVPLIYEDGSINGIVGISRDISELKKLEEEIRASEEKYRFLFEHSPIGFFIYDTNARITQCNQLFIDILQSSADKLIGLDMHRLHDRIILDPILKSLQGEEGFYEGWYRATTSLAHVCVMLKTTPLYNAEKKVIGGMGLVDEITERKKAELEIQKSENHFRSIWENSFDGMRVVDEKGIIRSVNKAFCDMVKKSKEELIGQHFSLMYKASSREQITKRAEENIKTKSVPPHYERKLELWDNTNIWFEVMNSFMEMSENENYLLSIFRNISERKLAEEKINIYLEELKELNKSKDKFFSIVAHDLKSPFQGLLGLSEILFEDYNDLAEEQILQYLKMIRTTTKDVYRLIENLLDWSRLQTGRMEYKTEKLELYQIADGVVKLISPTASKKNIQLFNQIKRSSYVIADMNMLNSVIQNLISNAVKFTDTDGIIAISSEEKETFHEICVADNGVGMSQKDLSKLFKLDDHFSTKGTRDESGTGLGLLLCKELVEKHGGIIWVESEEGKGTKFHFTIPKA